MLLTRSLVHPDEPIRLLAYSVVAATLDSEMVSVVARSNWTASNAKDVEAFYGSQVLAAAFPEAPSLALLSRMTPRFQWRVAAQHDRDTRATVALGLESLLRKGVAVDSMPPNVEIESNLQDTSKYSTYRTSSNLDLSLAESIQHGNDALKAWNEKNRTAILDYLDRLDQYGVRALTTPISAGNLKLLAADDPTLPSRLASIVEGAPPERLSLVLNFAMTVAIALSETETERAGALLAKLATIRPHINLMSADWQLPFDRLAIWKATSGPSISALRRERLLAATNDSLIAIEVASAEWNGERDFVIDFVIELLKEAHPARVARALTLAGYCDVDPRITAILKSHKFADGFLQDAAVNAVNVYERNEWARHWHDHCRVSTERTEYWRFAQLAIESADARFPLWFHEREDDGAPYKQFFQFMRGPLKRRAERKNQKRRELLYGKRKPSRD